MNDEKKLTADKKHLHHNSDYRCYGGLMLWYQQQCKMQYSNQQ
jgi:hypothetical protein